jgi:hypothetical protein
MTTGGLLSSYVLKIVKKTLVYQESVIWSSKRKFQFDQIECVLTSPDNKFSFQVGQEVFSVPFRPGKKRHQEFISALVREVELANKGSVVTGG